MDSLSPNNDGIEAIKTSAKNLNDEKRPPSPTGNNTGKSDVEDAETPALSRMQLALITIAISLAVFLMALDESIIATAIPKITDHFHSLKDVAWYGSAYMLTMCCFQLHYGKLYTYFSSKPILLISIGIFELGSLVCATSQSSVALIVGRAIAGGGAGGIVSGAFIVISKTVPLRERPTYTAAVGSIYGIASVAGPLLGGVITDSYLTWRWCFYLNIPCGVFSALIVVFFYHPPKDQPVEELTGVEHLKRMDPLGLIFFAAAIACLIFGLQISGSAGWSNLHVIVLLVLFGVFLLAFMAVQVWLQERATLPPRLIMKRQVISSSFFSMTIDGSYYGLSYFLPIWFQSVKGTSAAESGIRCLPMIIGAVIFSMISGIFISKTGNIAPVVFLATLMSAAGAGLLTTMSAQSGPREWIGYQAMMGIGVGLGMQQGVTIVQNRMDANDIPTAISTVVLFQGLGPTLLVSITQDVFDRLLYTKLVSIVPGLTTSTIFNSGATEIIKLVPSEEVSVGLSRISLALTQSWYVAVAAASLSGLGALGMGFAKLGKEGKVNAGGSKETSPGDASAKDPPLEACV